MSHRGCDVCDITKLCPSSTWDHICKYHWIPSIWVYHTPIHTTIFHMFFDVQHALCIPIVHMATNPSNIVVWHAFLFSLPGVYLSSTMWWERPPIDSHLPPSKHNKWLGDITKGTHNYSPSLNFSKILENGFGSLSTSIDVKVWTGYNEQT